MHKLKHTLMFALSNYPEVCKFIGLRLWRSWKLCRDKTFYYQWNKKVKLD